MKRTRIYNTSTGKWELWTITSTPLRPGRWLRLKFLLARRVLRGLHGIRREYPQEYVFDEVELRMKKPERNGRRAFLKISEAVMSMVKMQKFIK